MKDLKYIKQLIKKHEEKKHKKATYYNSSYNIDSYYFTLQDEFEHGYNICLNNKLIVPSKFSSSNISRIIRYINLLMKVVNTQISFDYRDYKNMPYKEFISCLTDIHFASEKLSPLLTEIKKYSTGECEYKYSYIVNCNKLLYKACEYYNTIAACVEKLKAYQQEKSL